MNQLRLFDSGATGGAALARGSNYQVDYTVYLSLCEILHTLRHSPIADDEEIRSLQMEPRIIDPSGVIRMDIHAGRKKTLYEVKANPSAADVGDFVRRVATASATNGVSDYHLVYDTLAAATHDSPKSKLRSLEKLKSLADEACGSEAQFQQLCNIEDLPPLAKELIDNLGSSSLSVLNSMSLTPAPHKVVRESIDQLCSLLVPTGQVEQLKEFLFQRFYRDMESRRTEFTVELIHHIEESGISLNRPQLVEPGELSEPVHSIVYILQRCCTPLPVDVLCTSLDVGSEVLRHKALSLRDRGAIAEYDTNWQINPLYAKSLIDHPQGPTLLGATLEALLQYLQLHGAGSSATEQFGNVQAIARECILLKVPVVADVFPRLDKIAKATGSKRLILSLAETTIKGVQEVEPQSRHTRQCEARALICGKSWVHQRVGHLLEAESEAARALEIARNIHDLENQAFCEKCIGRLKRMLAERELRARSRKRLIDESKVSLSAAIKSFSKHQDFGPSHSEVGDCYSLLARTHLFAKHLDLADAAVRKASPLLTDQSNKDHFDLLIVKADIATARFRYEEADAIYEAAIRALDERSSDASWSEIRARAHLHRGIMRQKWGKDDWEETILHAKREWEELEEAFMAAESEWEIMRLAERVPENQVRRLLNETPPVRVLAVKLLERNVRSQPQSKAIAFRAEVTDKTMAGLVELAREHVELRTRKW